MPNLCTYIKYPVVVCSAVLALTITLLSCAIGIVSIILLIKTLLALAEIFYLPTIYGLIYFVSILLGIGLSGMLIYIYFRAFPAEDTLTVCEEGLYFTKRGLIRYADMIDYHLDPLTGTVEFRCKQKKFRQTVNLTKNTPEGITNHIFVSAVNKSITTWLSQTEESKKKPKKGGFYGSTGGRITGVAFFLFGFLFFYIIYHAYFIKGLSLERGLPTLAIGGFLLTVQGLALIFTPKK